MSESAVETVLAALIFAALLVLERRSQRSVVRLGTAILALVVLFLAQPDYTTAARRVSVARPEERITQLHGSPISEYESGVVTMYEATRRAREDLSMVRLLALGVVFWLSCSQAVRRERKDTGT